MAVCLAGAARQAWSTLPVDLAEKQSDGRPQHDNMIIQRPQSSAPDTQVMPRVQLSSETSLNLLAIRLDENAQQPKPQPSPQSRCSPLPGHSPATAPSSHSPWPRFAGAGTHAPTVQHAAAITRQDVHAKKHTRCPHVDQPDMIPTDHIGGGIVAGRRTLPATVQCYAATVLSCHPGSCRAAGSGTKHSRLKQECKRIAQPGCQANSLESWTACLIAALLRQQALPAPDAQA